MSSPRRRVTAVRCTASHSGAHTSASTFGGARSSRMTPRVDRSTSRWVPLRFDSDCFGFFPVCPPLWVPYFSVGPHSMPLDLHLISSRPRFPSQKCDGLAFFVSCLDQFERQSSHFSKTWKERNTGLSIAALRILPTLLAVAVIHACSTDKNVQGCLHD